MRIRVRRLIRCGTARERTVRLWLGIILWAALLVRLYVEAGSIP